MRPCWLLNSASFAKLASERQRPQDPSNRSNQSWKWSWSHFPAKQALQPCRRPSGSELCFWNGNNAEVHSRGKKDLADHSGWSRPVLLLHFGENQLRLVSSSEVLSRTSTWIVQNLHPVRNGVRSSGTNLLRSSNRKSGWGLHLRLPCLRLCRRRWGHPHAYTS